jgi:hypothetical protein
MVGSTGRAGPGWGTSAEPLCVVGTHELPDIDGNELAWVAGDQHEEVIMAVSAASARRAPSPVIMMRLRRSAASATGSSYTNRQLRVLVTSDRWPCGSEVPVKADVRYTSTSKASGDGRLTP